MRTFIFTTESKPRRTYGGSNVTAQVYEIKKNLPHYVGQAKWCTASFPGETTAVMRMLAEKGILKVKEARGYYTGSEDAPRADGKPVNFRIIKI